MTYDISNTQTECDSSESINEASSSKPSPAAVALNPEVQVRKPKRRFTASYKLQILEELDRCAVPERGAVIRREGLYSSRIAEWRKARKNGSLSALNRAVGRKPKYDDKDKKISSLESEVTALKNQLSQAQAIMDVQKKVSEIFGCMSPASHTSKSENK